MKIHTILASSLLIPSLGFAEDFTVEAQPFKVETTLDAVFLPTQSKAIHITPAVWTDSTITELVSQGTVVKKGTALITVDTSNLDAAIAQSEKARTVAQLTVADAQRELAQLEITTPISLEATARAEKDAAENLKWFTTIEQPKLIENAQVSVKEAQQALDYINEELKQLIKMYKDDGKVEETEEIILVRTRNVIQKIEFALKTAKIKADHAVNTVIPRKLTTLQLAAKNTSIAHADAKQKLPNALEQKRLSVAKSIADEKLATENLTKLKADRSMLNITAPAAGVVYYGSIKDGRWSSTAATKSLKVGAKLPVHTTVMTFIPANSPLVLSAFTSQENLPELLAATPSKTKGYALTALNRYQSISVQLSGVSTYPETDGTFHVSLKPTIAKNVAVVPGMHAQAYLTSFTSKSALKVPSSYLTRNSDGNITVNVKLADGKPDSRTVTIGASNADWVIITKGLEKGQVIVK